MNKAGAKVRKNDTTPEVPTDAGIHATIRLWILRMLVPLGGHNRFLGEHSFADMAVVAALGLDDWARAQGGYDRGRALEQLVKMHSEVETSANPDSPPDLIMRNNLERVGDLVGLTHCDRRVLEFAVFLHSDSLIGEVSSLLGPHDSYKTVRVMALVLGIPEREIKSCLRDDKALSRSGLLRIDHRVISHLMTKIDLISHTFTDAICSPETEPLQFFSGIITAVEPPELVLDDFAYIDDEVRVLRACLRRSLEVRHSGVNAFIHGPPGTGKSQLARVIAKEAGCALYEVPPGFEIAKGSPSPGEQRLRAFQLAQKLCAGLRSLLVFDEAEDIFRNGSGLFDKSTAQLRKALINKTLEGNPVPTIWISNSIAGLDPAFVRRFDVIVEVPTPPRRQRAAIIRRACTEELPERTVAAVALSDAVTPGVIVRAAGVVGRICDELGPAGSASAFERLISATLQAQGNPPLMRSGESEIPEGYDLSVVTASEDLAVVAQGLAQSRSGRLCLHGPPGTGKTVFGRWLADRMELPLHVRRASDILDRYVGGTEQRIARIFHEAEREGAVLMLDEIDGLLRERSGAKVTWEITMVNEMLTQMESYPGIFIASTNLLDDLDQASLRRFDLKIKFGFLRVEAAWKLFVKHCATLGLAGPDDSLCSVLRRLSVLTPGDFAAVVRRHRFSPLSGARAFLDALAEECSLKSGASHGAIGFGAASGRLLKTGATIR